MRRGMRFRVIRRAKIGGGIIISLIMLGILLADTLGIGSESMKWPFAVGVPLLLTALVIRLMERAPSHMGDTKGVIDRTVH